jgi:hypothetical protein
MKARSTLVAVDTNFLLDLAGEVAFCHEALDVMRRRLPALAVLVPPTTLDELGHAANKPNPLGRHARHALQRILRPWKFRPVDFGPVQHGIAERIGEHIRAKLFLPASEINDGLILAEAALLRCTLLITSDPTSSTCPPGLCNCCSTPTTSQGH